MEPAAPEDAPPTQPQPAVEEDGMLSATTAMARDASVLFQSRRYAECAEMVAQLLLKEGGPKVSDYSSSASAFPMRRQARRVEVTRLYAAGISSVVAAGISSVVGVALVRGGTGLLVAVGLPRMYALCCWLFFLACRPAHLFKIQDFTGYGSSREEFLRMIRGEVRHDGFTLAAVLNDLAEH